MKTILILGGNYKANIKWITEMKKLYSKDYKVIAMKYNHWENDNEINFDEELLKISKFNNIDYVIAKSIGIYITVKAIENNLINPEKIIFMGYPLKVLEENNIDILDTIFTINKNSKITFIQQNNDPLCLSKELKEILNNHIPLIQIEGNDHSYDEYKAIKKYIDKIL